MSKKKAPPAPAKPSPGGDAAGLGGLGLKGMGAGGGSIGIQSGLGTIGRGSGSGSYGSGSGSLRGSVASSPGVVMGGVQGGVVQGYAGGVVGGVSAGAAGRPAAPPEPSSADAFQDHGVNPFTTAREDHLSTFAVDVDTASYAIARRRILEGALPAAASVRVEEFLNYFRYAYEGPSSGPVAVHLDAAPSPFSAGRHLLRVGVQGKQLAIQERKPMHLTFLVDVSGSMQSPDRLPLAKRALRILVDSLRDGDTVALVTYAGAVKDVLGPTGMEHKARIYSAIEDLTAGGSTAMASGIDLAYRNAMKTLDGQSASRVIILSDGDANVGTVGHDQLLQQIRRYVKEGITVTTVGFGMGNYKDTMMEQFANQGNGNYYYVDSLMQAKRVFHEQLGGTLEVIAQDVKLQVDFDPAQVKRYRLVGYENRAIADVSFRDDAVDAGEIGSGHTVTALYEVELEAGATGEGLCTVRLRAKKPRGERAEEWAFPFRASRLAPAFQAAPADFRFAAAVMAAAEKLRNSPHARQWDLEEVIQIARGAAPAGNAERAELISLLEKARPLVGAVARRQ